MNPSPPGSRGSLSNSRHYLVPRPRVPSCAPADTVPTRLPNLLYCKSVLPLHPGTFLFCKSVLPLHRGTFLYCKSVLPLHPGCTCAPAEPVPTRLPRLPVNLYYHYIRVRGGTCAPADPVPTRLPNLHYRKKRVLLYARAPHPHMSAPRPSHPKLPKVPFQCIVFTLRAGSHVHTCGPPNPVPKGPRFFFDQV